MTESEPNEVVLSGLDMKATLDWYAQNENQIKQRLPEQDTKEPFRYPLVAPENVLLSESELTGLVNLFPQNALKRSILDTVVGQPETWFSRFSTKTDIKPTTNQIEAISKTAIIPGYTQYKKGPEGAWLADIWLYKIGEAISPDVRRIVLSEAFAHEFAHTIITPELYRSSQLKLPDGSEVESKEYLRKIAEMSLDFPPISHYASTYRDDKGQFIEGNEAVAMNEEIAETVAASLLNFSFRKDNLGLSPLSDRPEIAQKIKDYLEAERL